LTSFRLFSETAKGYWIGYGFDNGHSFSWKKWVSKTARKRYAYPTKEEALNNYVKRTERRIKILQAQIESCYKGLSEVKHL